MVGNGTLTEATRAAARARPVVPARILPGHRRDPRSPASTHPEGRGTTVTYVRCFGGLHLVRDGRELDLSGLKPQARAVLGCLAMQAGKPLHHERLVDALWPDDPPDAGGGRLHVLISTLRRYLEPDAQAGAWTILVRRGEAYALCAGRDATFDVGVFDDAIVRARRLRQLGDRGGEAAALQEAFDAYGGELLPECGAAEWVIRDREHYRDRFALVAHAVARRHLAAGDPGAAADAAMTGLSADRFRSQLWEALVDAYRASGDRAAAARAAGGHAAVLAELGIQVPLSAAS